MSRTARVTPLIDSMGDVPAPASTRPGWHRGPENWWLAPRRAQRTGLLPSRPARPPTPSARRSGPVEGEAAVGHLAGRPQGPDSGEPAAALPGASQPVRP